MIVIIHLIWAVTSIIISTGWLLMVDHHLTKYHERMDE